MCVRTAKGKRFALPGGEFQRSCRMS